MSYHLGIDLGTTYTAAATHTAGRIEMVSLGERGPTMPSVLYLGPDGNMAAGDAANRHAVTDAQRVAREFKRRLGDPTPILLGGVPTPPETLTSHLLRWVYQQVCQLAGAPPDSVALTYPANWGPYKQDLLTKAAEVAGVPVATLVTEPQAAAVHYASQERVSPGAVVAVYDLGGGTFDAAVLRKDPDGGFTILGNPEGLERLGGVDFDEAIFAHLTQTLEDHFDDLDPEDEAAVGAAARLRQECTQAKEALSLDTEVTIPVLLPTVQTEVRITRAELEEKIRPPLGETVVAMERALRSANAGPADVSQVLLVGGSSRMPIVSELLSSRLGRPIAVDTHPKHSVAMGSAITAARAAGIMAGDAAAGDAVGAMAAAGVGAASAAASAGNPPPPPPPGPSHQGPQQPPPPPPPSGPTGQATSGDPTFDAVQSEAPPPSLGYRSASAPPPPGSSNDLPPGFMGAEQKAAAKRKERRKSRVGAVFAALVVLAAIAATLVITQAQNQTETLADVEVGKCYTGEPGDLQVVDCAEEHNGELIARLNADDPEGDFPSEELGDPMSLRCEGELADYFGADREVFTSSGLTMDVYAPSEGDWEDGTRHTDCVATMEDGSVFTGSIEGSGAEE